MGINAIWDNTEKTIIRYDYEGTWTWDDLHKALEESHTMMRTVSHPVDVIIDVSSSRLIPSGALGRSKNITDNKPDNHGKTMVVGANSFIQGLSDLFRKIYRKELTVTYVATLEEARRQLATQRESVSS
jgi:hypothetical protein